ncbi:MAG TPA: tetratricopeptide repeat protein [Polyangiaceae bacterium]|nr:tetratricopeptide repeat protein [Polyangiaceae bacterium]
MHSRWTAYAVALGLTVAAPCWAADEEPAPSGERPTESEPPKATGAPSYKKAKSAWTSGDMATAEVFYREAIAKGGLAPDEVLESYVRLGTARLLLGRKDQALTAYRAAAVIDDAFDVPAEGGPRAVTLADTAKKDMASVGSLVLGLSCPSRAKPGEAFTVRAKVDDNHARVLTRVGLSAKDGSTGRELYFAAKSAQTVEFEIPAKAVLPGSTLVVRVDALDSHDNRLASAASRVEVSGTKPTPPPPVVAKAKPPPKKEPVSFFRSPWTYIVGGAVLAGAGASVFLLTRPTDDVTIGAVSVRAR